MKQFRALMRLAGVIGVCLLVFNCFAVGVNYPPIRTTNKPHLREIRTENYSKYILAFDIANSSNLAAVALDDHRVRVWKLDSGEIVHEFSFPEPKTDARLKLDDDVEPVQLHFSLDGNVLAVGFLSVIHLYVVGTWQEEKSLGVSGEDDLSPDVTATPPNPQLKRRTSEDADAERQKPVPTLNEATKARFALMERGDGRTRIADFTFTKDGLYVLAAYCRGSCYAWRGRRSMFPTGRDPVRLWDIRTERIVWENLYDPKGVMARVTSAPDGKRFAAINAELGHCAAGVYDLSDGRLIWSHPLGPCSEPPSILFLNGGQSLITSRADEATRKNKLWGKMAIYETSDGKKISDLSSREGVRVADVSSDEHWLASTSWWGRQFQIWDLQTKQPVITEVPIERKSKSYRLLDRVRFSPDGSWLVVGSNEVGVLVVYQLGSP